MFQKQVAFSLLCTFVITLILTTTTSNAQIQAGEKDPDKYYTVTSEDGIDVPVPYGFCPSNNEDERYVNGKIENKTGTIIATLPTTNLTNWAYEDVTINGETDKYWYNTTTNECSIETPIFTIGEQGGAIDVEWSASMQTFERYESYQSRIELIPMNGLVEQTEDVIDIIAGYKLGTNLNSLGFELLKKELKQGSYKIKVVYDGGEVQLALNKAYIKKLNVLQYNSGSDVTENIKTKSGGFVIYEATTETLNSNTYDYNTRNYNQYVWVPVPKELVTSMYSVSDGKYILKGLDFTSKKTGYETTYSLFDYLADVNILLIDTQKTYLKKYLSGINRDDFSETLTEEYKEVSSSIETYGRFYVGIYENGKEGNSSIPVTKKCAGRYINTWYSSYKNIQYALNVDCKSSLMWNHKWDFVLRWFVSSQEKSNYDINSSTSWGNHFDSQFKYLTSSGEIKTKARKKVIGISTGSSEYTNANGIYDFCGSSSQWIINRHFYRTIVRAV